MPAIPTLSALTGGTNSKENTRLALVDLHAYLTGTIGAAGTQAAALAALGAALNATTAKSSAYSVVAGDRGKLIDCTSGTFSLTLLAAATAGDGFAFGVRNSGTGTITIDPNSSEQIDGATTITLAAGQSCLCVCNGSAWKTVGRTVAVEYGVFLGIYAQTTPGTGLTATRPAGATKARIIVQGGGGNGATMGEGGNYGPCKGGNGGYAEAIKDVASNLTVTVGGAGAASTVTNGSWTIQGSGGANAVGNYGSCSGGAAGGASGGDVNLAGGGSLLWMFGKGGYAPDTFGTQVGAVFIYWYK